MAFERSKKNSSTKNNRYKKLVNTTTPYENLIAAKLDQIPVPDMADSIWNSIEMQLDAVPDAPAEKPSLKYKGKGWYGFAAIVVVTTLLFWYYHHKNHAPENITPLKSSPATEKPSPVTDSNTLINNIEEKNTRPAPVNIKKEKSLPNDTLNISISTDSVSTQKAAPIKIDSLALPNTKDPVRVFDTVYTIPTRKKHKGVKGITQDDYRLDVNKDSIPKKQ
ncbi:hypothetical protein [Chitinophaga sp. RAB17]|uniref:hypothetical protein n=1 Tax=Chitinophaga sp. RAB17 TaxID=3233049 RepID=UPI003F936337